MFSTTMSEKPQAVFTPSFREMTEYFAAEETENLRPQFPTPSSGSSFHNFTRYEPLGKVLYKDKVVIRQMYDTVMAEIEHSKSFVGHSQLDATSNLCEQLISLEWSCKSDTNFDYLVLLLSSTVQIKESVRDFRNRISNEKSVSDSIYPGMPLRVCGVIQAKTDVSDKEICLHIDEFSVCIILEQEHTFYENASFLIGRYLFVLGITQNVERNSIKAGAVFIIGRRERWHSLRQKLLRLTG